MVTILFRMKAKDGKADEAQAQLKKMTEAVEAQEPATLAYVFHRSQQDAAEFVLFEVYQDEAAMQSHMQTAHMGEFRATLGDLVDPSSVKLERLDRAGGFARGG